MMNPQARGALMLPVWLVVGLVVAEAAAELYQTDPTIKEVTVQGRIKLSSLPKDYVPILVYRDSDYRTGTRLVVLTSEGK